MGNCIKSNHPRRDPTKPLCREFVHPNMAIQYALPPDLISVVKPPLSTKQLEAFFGFDKLPSESKNDLVNTNDHNLNANGNKNNPNGSGSDDVDAYRQCQQASMWRGDTLIADCEIGAQNFSQMPFGPG